MTLDEVYERAILPAYERLPSRMRSARATVQLLVTGLQESRFEHRHQIGGPAHGYWQFEQGGGVAGVMRHPSTSALIRAVCSARGTPFTTSAVFAEIEHDDVLAAIMARLLYYADPRPLPALGDSSGAWDCYLRNWRPGKPHPGTWAPMYSRALLFATNE